MFVFAISVALLSLCLGLWSLWQLQVFKRRLNTALSNSNGDSLEKTLHQHMSRIAEVNDKMSKLLVEYQKLADVAGLASQKISVVRFNAFGDTGGDQSFVLAVLDAHNSGYIVTSIHGREGTRIYIKPLDYGKTKYTLSQEEQQALNQAMKRIPPEGAKHGKT